MITFLAGIQTFTKSPISIVLFLLLFTTSAHAEERLLRPQDPVHNIDGNTHQKIEHRMSPEIYNQSPFSGHAPGSIAKAPPSGSKATVSSPVSYNGGPVMPSVSKIVLLWYGNWNQSNGTDTPAGQQIIRDAIWGLSVSNSINNYSGITTGYSSSLGNYSQTGGASVTQASASAIVEFTQATSNTYGGKTLSDSSIYSLVKAYAGTGDPNAIYLVLSSSDISESSGFLTRYCGWHTFGSVGNNKIKYGFIGNPNRSLSACAVQNTSPNGNAAVDAMVSVIAHELVETVNDPLLNAWYNSSGSESSDLCAWTYGSQLHQASNGSYWNMSLPTANGASRNYLLQRQLASKDSKCYINATGSVQ
jgi:hypothetical protein